MTPNTPATVERSAENETLTEAIVIAISDGTGVDPLDLDPLYDSLDPDALERTVDSTIGETADPGEVTFTHAGCEVTVHDDRRIVVAPRGTASPTTGSVASLE